MVSSKATTVEQYLAELPQKRRADLAALIKLVREHIPKTTKKLWHGAWSAIKCQ